MYDEKEKTIEDLLVLGDANADADKARKKERKREKKERRKNKKKKRRGSSSSSSNSSNGSAPGQAGEEADLAGPAVPQNFFEELKEKEELAEQTEKMKRDLIMGSYKRPRRQRAPEPLHPADERKLQAEKALKE